MKHAHIHTPKAYIISVSCICVQERRTSTFDEKRYIRMVSYMLLVQQCMLAGLHSFTPHLLFGVTDVHIHKNKHIGRLCRAQ